MMLLLFPRTMTTQNRYRCSSPVRVHRRRHHRRHHPVHATRSSRSRTRNKASHHYRRRRRNIRIRRRRRCYHLGLSRKKKRQHPRISRRRPQRCRSIIHGILSFEQQQDTTKRNRYILQECNKNKATFTDEKGEEIGG